VRTAALRKQRFKFELVFHSRNTFEYANPRFLHRQRSAGGVQLLVGAGVRRFESIKRVDFGHMDLVVTVTDPKTYETPWTQTLRYTLLPDTDLFEFVCEVNPAPQHMVR